MEHRRFHRLLLKVNIKLSQDESPETETAKSKNISKGGICVTTYSEPLAVGKLHHIEFALPGRENMLRLDGRVVWNRKYQEGDDLLFDNGIQFLEVTDQHRHIIEEFSIGSLEY